jgi:uncharacterized protein YecT (DUF1311 family)
VADLLDSCLEAAESRAEAAGCRGAYARACVGALEDGDAPAVGAACAAAEAGGWDTLMNEVYADLVLLARRRAIRAEEEGAAPTPLAEALDDAQRAWLAFRDLDCEGESLLWEEADERAFAATVCRAERTAGRVLDLRARREAMAIN